MPEEQDIQTDEFGIPIKKKAQVNNTSIDEFGIPIKKKDSGTALKNGGSTPASTTTSQHIKSNSALPSFLQRGNDIATGKIFNNIGQQQATTTGNISLNNGKSALDADLDFTFNNLLDAPDSKSPLSLSNISSLDSDPSLLDMPKEQQIEAKKRAIKNDPDLLRDYRIKRTAEIKTIKQGAEVNKSQNTSFVPISDNQTGVVIDPAAVAQAASVISAADQYETQLQESIKSAAKIAVPKSFIDKNEPLDSKKVGQKYLETIGDPSVRDEVNVIDGLQNTDVVVMGLTVQGEAKYSGTDIEKTQQGIQYKFDKSGSAVISDYFLDQAKQIATAEPDKISAYVTAKQRRADSKDKIEQSQLDSQLSMMLQDESVRSFQGALGQSENYAIRYDKAADQYPQVKRAQLRQQYNDAYMSIIAGQDEVDAVTGMGAKVLLRGLFGSTPNKSEIQKIATMTGQPVEEVQAEIDNGGFFKDTPYTVRINGFLQGIAGGAKEAIAESQMGMRRSLNFDNAATDNAVTQTNLDEYTLQAHANKMRDDSSKWNVNPYTIFNTMGHGLGQSAIFAGPTLGAGAIAVEGTVAARLAEAATTVASGYAGSYEGAYKEAAKYTADEDLRREYANYTAFENAIPELLLSPADIIKKMSPGRPGTKGAFQAFAKEASEKGLEETVAQKMAVFGKQLGNVVLAENVEESATNVTNNLTKERLFGVQTSASDWLNQAFETAVTTTITTIPLGIGAGIGGVNDVSGVRKEGYFEAGNEPELYTVKLQDMFAKGLLSQEQLDQKIQVINTMAGIVAGVNKMTKADGSPLSYSEKADVAAQQFRINNNNSILKGNPIDGVKPIIEADNNEALNIQNNILSSNTNQNEKSSEQAHGQDVNAEEGQRGTVQPKSVPGEEEKILAELGVAEPVSSEAPNQEDVITIQDVIDKPVIYNGQRGKMYQDGQAVVIKIDGQNREYEIGNIDELKGKPIGEFGIEHEQSVVSINDAGGIEVRGEVYTNDFEDPLRAIYKDDNGNLMHVSLKTKDGKDKLFGGAIAEDLAYQITLKEINKTDETRQQFEDFLNTDEISVELGSVPEITAQEATSDNTEVQREKVESVSSKTEETPSTVKSESTKKEFNFKTGKGNRIFVDKKYAEAEPDNNNFIALKIVSPNGEELGGVQLNETENGYEIELSGINADRHREGIGKDAYISLIENLDKPLISGKSNTEHGLTDGARALWESLKRDGYATFNEKEGRYISKNIPAETETKKFTNSGSEWTHLTNSDEAIESLIKTGKFIGKGEKLENFVKEVSDKRFNLSHENASSPYFQKGKFYGEPKQKWLIVAQGEEKFTPNINHGNAKSFEYSKGVGVLNPENRSIENFEIYKRGKDGEYYKYDFKDETIQDAKPTEPVKIGPDEKQPDEVPVATESSSAGTEAPSKNQRGSGQEPPTTGENTAEDGEEEAPMGITQAAVSEMRKKIGLPAYDRTRVTDASLEALADQIISQGYDIVPLIEKIEEGNQPSGLETVILAKYKAVLDQTVADNPSDENIRLAQRFAEAVDKSGTEEGRAFRLRRFIPVGEQSLSDFFVREMDTEHVETLTDDQKKTVTNEYNAIQSAQETAEAATLKLQQAADEKKASEGLDKIKKEVGSKKNKKSHEEYVKDREKIAGKIKNKLKQFRSGQQGLTAVPLPYVRELYAIAPDIASYIKSLAEEGITKLADVTDSVFDILKDNIPEATKRDAHDLIAGVYNVNAKSKSALTQQVRDWREEARLLNKLESLMNGDIPVSAIKNVQRNRDITELRNKIKQIQQTNTIVSQEEQAFYTEEFLNDAVKIRQAAETYRKNAEAIEEEIKSGVFAPLEKKVPITQNAQFKKDFPHLFKEAVDAQDRLIKARKDREIRLAEIEYKNRTKWQKAWDVILAPIREVRSLKSSFDYSAPLRQGIIPTTAELIRDPIGMWNRMRRMVKSSADVKFFDRWMDDLRNTELWNVMQKSGLAIADPNSFGNKEEVFQSRFAQKIPGVKGSERAYAYFLNSQRVDMFAKGVKIMSDKGMTYENSKEEYQHWANTVNTLTGRGKLAKSLENSASPLSAIFFSPRLMAARLSMFNPFFYKNIPAPLRKMVAKDVGSFVTLAGGIIAAVALFTHGDDDEWSVALNPGNPDFLKLKNGNTRYDIFGGYLQYIRLIARPTGKIFGENTMKDNGLPDVLATSMRSKLAPFPGSVWNIAAGKDLVGNKVTLGSEAAQFLIPLVWKDTYDAIKDQGVQGLATVTLPAALGVGVSTYKKK